MNRNELLKVFDIVKPAIYTRDFVPILKNYYVDKERMVASNGELMIETKCNLFDNEILIPSVVERFLRDLTSEDISIKILSASTLRVESETMMATFSCPLPSSYPLQKVFPPNDSTHLPISDQFLGAIKELIEFIGKDETQPMFRGIYVSEEKLFASDGIKLAISKLPVPIISNLYLPEAFCEQLIRFCPASINISSKILGFSTGDSVVTHIRPILQSTPDFNRFLPLLDVNKNYFLIPPDVSDAILRMNIFTEGMSDKLCNIISDCEQLIFSVNNEFIGEIKEFRKLKTNESFKLITYLLHLHDTLKHTNEIRFDREYGVVCGRRKNEFFVILSVKEGR